MRNKFDFYEDGGHGWLKVKRNELVELEITDKITGCSYVSNNGKDVFLEEDCDATTFIEAWELYTNKKFNLSDQFNYHIADKQSEIRNYNSYVN